MGGGPPARSSSCPSSKNIADVPPRPRQQLYKTWPDPVRKPLKQAQKALEADNFVKAERYFSESVSSLTSSCLP